jgi:protein gp37
MADVTAIEWTDATWNPVSGCTKVSRGCDRCYAERFSERFRGVPGHAFEQGFDLRLWPQRLTQPARWKRSRRVFVNSMADLFHKNIPRGFVSEVLTKRSSLLRSFVNSRFRERPCPEHIWLGVSVEDRKALRRVDHLQGVNASVRFLSVEPLLEHLGEIDLTGIHWVIVGGESGPGFRAVDPAWVREVRDQCIEQDVPFFFKQWGGLRPKSGGNTLDGEVWQEYPDLAARRAAMVG